VRVFSQVKQALGLEEAVDHGDVAGFVVKDRQNGEIVHREYFESGKLPADRVVSAMDKKLESLAHKYSGGRYDIEHGIFNSVRSFKHYFPTRGE
jgi:hypothetical protein